MPDPPIKVSVYSYPVATGPRRHQGLPVRAARIVRGAAAAAICLAAHVLLYATAMWTAGAPEAPQKDLPPRVSVAEASDPDAMEWIALDPLAITEPSRPKPELPSSRLHRIDVRNLLQEAALLVPDVDLQPAPEATVADAGRLSKMYGRYVGQITARIDRAWRRPRTPIGDSVFSCQVRITQDALGNVMELMLEQCNGDARWQLSLVQAIQSASPLPAPPDPDVFSKMLHLGFTGVAFSPQSSPDEYEPQSTARAIEAAQDAHLADETMAHPGAGIIKLTIIGDHKAVEVEDPAAGK